MAEIPEERFFNQRVSSIGDIPTGQGVLFVEGKNWNHNIQENESSPELTTEQKLGGTALADTSVRDSQETVE